MSITFNGVNSDTIDLYVESYPERVIPARRVSVYEVSGRNGDIISTEDSYRNVAQIYSVFCKDVPVSTANLSAWLYPAKGYLRLEDSYNVGFFRLAYVSNGTAFENTFNRFGRGELEFTCKPQRWLSSGHNEIILANGDAVTNPYIFEAKPYFVVQGTGGGILNVGDVPIEIKDGFNGTINIDCETMNAWSGVVLMNNLINCKDFPTLKLGATEITWTGNITAVKIVPRWWTL